ncbi:MAG TPA: arylesterase [Gemmatimonadales bacterium]
MAALSLSTCDRTGGDSSAQRAAADSSPPPTALSAPTDLPAIVFLGTSLTAGLGVELDQAYPALIQQKIDSLGMHYRVVNAGVSGESSAGALNRIDWVMREKPTILLIETGANDGLRGQDLDSLKANIQAIINRVHEQAPNTRIILLGMAALPNLGAQYTKAFRAIYPAVARANHIPLVPFLLAGVAGVDSLNQEDGVHPTPAGHRIIANNVWPALESVLSKGT